MPHIIVECSENVTHYLKAHDFLKALGHAAIETKVFPIGGTRVRLYSALDCHIADGHDENRFVHIHLRIGAGRSEEVKKLVSRHIFAEAERVLKLLFDKHPIGLSLELSEINETTSFKQNNLHDYVEIRERKARAST